MSEQFGTCLSNFSTLYKAAKRLGQRTPNPKTGTCTRILARYLTFRAQTIRSDFYMEDSGPLGCMSRWACLGGRACKKCQCPVIDSNNEKQIPLCEASNDVERLRQFIESDMFGQDQVIPTNFGLIQATYMDYVASGKSLKCFERYIRQHVMPSYSNTHTELSYMSQQTTRLRDEARSIIRDCVNASTDDVVIFTGSGSTSAVNKLIHALDIAPSLTRMAPIVFVGPYEHHSNILPWREVTSHVTTISQTSQGLIDLQHLESELQKFRCCSKRLLIGSFSAASNVTGILTDVNSIASLMHSYGGYAFFDYACAAPYTDINMNPTIPLAYKDAVFISPHKFIGGPQTPGVLVAKRWVFRNPVPHGVGGGTVIFVGRTAHSYVSDVEHREEGGTPAIIESIRAGLVFKLKSAFTAEFIMAREMQMTRLTLKEWAHLPNLLILGNLTVDRLPIFSMMFMNSSTGRFVHHDFIALILNDVFGIQARSGCACAGPYALDLLGVTEKTSRKFQKMIVVTTDKKESRGKNQPHYPATETKNAIFKPGFVRLSFPYFISEECFNFVLKAIKLTAEKGWLLLPLYDYDRDSGKWWFRYLESETKNSLKDVTFKAGHLNVRKHVDSLPYQCIHLESVTSATSSTQSTMSARTAAGSHIPDLMPLPLTSKALNYQEILNRAEHIFAEAKKPGLFNISGTTDEFTAEDEKLRWFMLPKEAADIVNGRKVVHCSASDLPFSPGRNPKELYKKQSEHCSCFKIIIIIIVLIILLIVFFLLLVLVFLKVDFMTTRVLKL